MEGKTAALLRPESESDDDDDGPSTAIVSSRRQFVDRSVIRATPPSDQRVAELVQEDAREEAERRGRAEQPIRSVPTVA